MTETNDNDKVVYLNKDDEDMIHQIIMACGKRPLKEKVSLLYLSVDYIFQHNKELQEQLSETVTLH